MYQTKRIVLVISLIIFILLLVIFSNIFENNLIQRSKYKEIGNKYESFIKTTNFKIDNKDRYISYYKYNKYLEPEEVVTYVNIGLDKGFYNKVTYSNLKKDYLVLVNKFNRLEKNYEPKNLELINKTNFINGNSKANKLELKAKIAFEKMSNDAIKNGTPIYGQSAYRSYNIQEGIYNNEVRKYGTSVADSESARPGFSEHQTGLAIDISSTKKGNMLEFENTESFFWIKENAYKYGFILRYPKGKEHIHGYIYEPWHYRYVGIEVAKDMHDNYENLTYDEYYYKFVEKKKG